MPIPRRILQTSGDASSHEAHSESWIRENPGYEYAFYSDEDCVAFLETFYPQLLKCYQTLPNAGQRADFFRYVNIYHFGGFYFDADTLCLEPLDHYLSLDCDMIVGQEMLPKTFKGSVAEYVETYATPRQILQWAFAATPKSPVLEGLIKLINLQVTAMSPPLLERFSESRRFTLELTGPIAFTHAVYHHIASRGREGIVILNQLAWGYNPWHHTKVDPHEHPDVKLIHLYAGSWHQVLQLYVYIPTRPARLEDEAFRRYLQGLFSLTKVIGIVLCVDAPAFDPSPELRRWMDTQERVQVVAAKDESTPSRLLSGLEAIPEDACVLMTSDEMIHTRESVRALVAAYEREPDKLSTLLVTHMPDLTRPELKAGVILAASKLKAVHTYPIAEDCTLCPESWLAWCFEQMDLPVVQVENDASNWRKLFVPSQPYPAWHEGRRQRYAAEGSTKCMESLRKQAAFWRG